jgi:spore coat polysaccharide biosynthesis protein SpsF
MPVVSAVDVLGRQTLEELSDHGEVHPVSPLDKKASSWDVCITDAAKWTRLGAAHIAVDTPADYWRLIDAVEAVGENPYTVSSWLAQNQKP